MTLKNASRRHCRSETGYRNIDALSYIGIVLSGVSQRSFLGPTLFLTLMTLQYVISHRQIYLYKDSTVINTSHSNLTKMFNNMSSDLSLLIGQNSVEKRSVTNSKYQHKIFFKAQNCGEVCLSIL